MELVGIIVDRNAFLEHHGVKGMHWGVWNAETAAKYKGLKKAVGGGGGGDDDDEDIRPETLLEQGLITEDEAKKIREEFDKIIADSENGKYNHLDREQQELLYRKALEKVINESRGEGTLGLTSGGVHWTERELNKAASQSKEDRRSDAREMIREWSADGASGIMTAMRKNLEVERRANENGSDSSSSSTVKTKGGSTISSGKASVFEALNRVSKETTYEYDPRTDHAVTERTKYSVDGKEKADVWKTTEYGEKLNKERKEAEKEARNRAWGNPTNVEYKDENVDGRIWQDYRVTTGRGGRF